MSPPARPLVLTGDDVVLDDILRLAAAAGADAEVASDAGAARTRWPSAPLVVVGDDRAAELLALVPPRRDAVVLVARDADDPAVWRRALSLGAERVVCLPEDEQVLAGRFADVVEGAAGRGVVVGVAGGRGGSGATVLAVALAMTGARRGLRTILVDADPLGGGIDLMLGAEHSRGLRWPELAETRGRVGGATLREHLPERYGLTVLSWDRGAMLAVPAEAVRAVVGAARRSWDLVVVDLPRRTDPPTEEALACCTCALLVVPAEVRAVAAAARVATGLALATADVRVVVRGPSPSGLRPVDVAAALRLPLVAELGPEPGLAEALERGEPPGRGGRGPIVEVCDELLDELAPELGSRAA